MFQDVLHKIASNVEGVIGVLLLDPDAVTIAESIQADARDTVSTLAVELANTLRALGRQGALEDCGACHEFELRAERMRAIALSVQGGHWLIAAIEPNADRERAHRMMRLMVPWIERLF